MIQDNLDKVVEQTTPIKDEIFQRLDLLAAKLGVASAHLWEVLTRQGMVEGIFGILLVIVGGLSAWGAYKLITYAVSIDPIVRENGYGGKEEVISGRAIVSGIFGGLLSVMALITFFNGLYACHYLLNPEYFALTKILQLFN